MDSIFTKIIKREIPSYIIEETDDYIAFLDVFPLVKGHTLIVPKQQVDNIFDLDDNIYLGLWKFAKKISVKVEQAIVCERIGVAVIGLEVPHAHIHLVPINNVQDINFAAPKIEINESEMLDIQKRIVNS